MLYRLYFKLSFVLFLCLAIVVTALWPYVYLAQDGFGIYVDDIGGFHVQWIYPI